MLRLTLVLVLNASLAAPEAEPRPIAVDPHALRAGELFEAGNYVEAAEEFAAAFEATGQSVFLFAQAQALRRAGSCGGTIEVLQRYLESTLAEADRTEAERIIQECQEVLGATSESPSPPAPRPPTPEPESPRPRPVAADPLGASLVGVGAGVGLTGAVLIGAGYRLARPRETPETAYEARAKKVRGMSVAGTVLVSAGASLLIAGVVRYVLVARRGRTSGREQARSAVWSQGSLRW